jgi:hypothetical protein
VRAGWQALAPDTLDQPVDRHRLVGVQQQDRQHRALLLAAERQRATVHADVQRTQNPVVHAPSVRFSRQGYHRSANALRTLCDRLH